MLSFEPDRLYLRTLPQEYQRGRTPLESENLFREFLTEFGINSDIMIATENEVDALKHALDWAQAGDVVVHLVHLERSAVQEYLQGIGARI